MKKYGFGVDVGGTTVKMGFFETSGELLDKWEIKTDTSDNGKAVLPLSLIHIYPGIHLCRSLH